MEYLAKNLQPGVTYALQMRSTSAEDVSAWSPVFIIKTASDSTIPGNVTSLTGSIVGSSFKLHWSAVRFNTNGTRMRDLKDYQITITSSTYGTAVRYSTSPGFLYTFEMNVEDFGTADPNLTFDVVARDTTGNLSPTPATVSLSNPIPSNVTGLVATSFAESVHLVWNAVADTDIAFYNVYAGSTVGFVADPSSLVFSSKTLSYDYPATTGATVYFKVLAVDVFGQMSGTPATANSIPAVQKDHDTFAFTYTGDIALLTGTQPLYFEAPYAIISCRASVGTAPTGSAIIVDILKNGVTIFTTTAHRPTISASNVTSGAVTNMDVTNLAAGDFLTVNVAQIGSTIPGSDLTVTVRVQAA